MGDYITNEWPNPEKIVICQYVRKKLNTYLQGVLSIGILLVVILGIVFIGSLPGCGCG
jgi:hypothetical protein